MDTFNGLPAHPLFVHAVVVGVPATALAALVIAIWPRARAKLGVVPTVLAFATLIAVPITTSAGEALEGKVGPSAALADHARLGDQLILAVGPLFGLIALLWLLPLPSVHSRIPLSNKTIGIIDRAARIATAVVAIAAAILILRVGDSGAKSAWMQP
ncbi:hypothetical protein [Gordonia malaquae]|uniref:hypothetical protein n=1 Tax=Gordonia malaquae TaxID=410332 RepID=UPI0030FE3D99